jgi:hypothetical protein
MKIFATKTLCPCGEGRGFNCITPSHAKKPKRVSASPASQPIQPMDAPTLLCFDPSHGHMNVKWSMHAIQQSHTATTVVGDLHFTFAASFPA